MGETASVRAQHKLRWMYYKYYKLSSKFNER
jgi:hypothetical protein